MIKTLELKLETSGDGDIQDITNDSNSALLGSGLIEGTATIFHKESIAMGKESPLKAYYHIRNRILFMRRNYQGIQLFVFYLFMVFVIIPKTFLIYAVKRKGKHIRSVVEAIKWHVSGQKKSLYF